MLLEHLLDDLAVDMPAHVLEAIAKMRTGDRTIEPGYDGVFGRVEIPFSG
ncbi:hypothetical protein IH601_00725 [Candidatus Bipolaricaulota bacterium]|nr:hypothetical protein [Candidatus Bipolaricaulota bacterium]